VRETFKNIYEVLTAMSKHILVTGGAGFIGSFIVDKMVELGNEVRIFDNLDSQVHPNGRPSYLNPKAEFVKGDVAKKDELRKALEDVEIVFHEASAVGVGQSMYQIAHYTNVNNIGTANLLDILVNGKHNVGKILVAASMSSYGEGLYECQNCGIKTPPLRTEEQMAAGKWELICKCGRQLKPIPTPETKNLDSNSIYALSKKDQEEMVLMIGKTYGIPAVSLRYFNVFGPRQSLSNPYTGVAAIFMSRIKNDHRPVVYEDGLQTRDFISVHDIVDANISAMKSNSANYESFNVGSGKPQTIKGIAETLAGMYGKNIKPEVTLKFRKGDVRHCFADMSKIKSKIGWQPRVSFEGGMKELIEWSRKEESIDKFDDARRELEERGLV